MEDLFKKPTAILISLCAIAIRLLPHPANMTPLGATALFGGAKIGRPWNYLAPLLILFVTDLFLGFHALMPYVYGCFALSVFLSEYFLKNAVTVRKLTTLAIVNSLVFFLVTNLAVWAEGRLYAPTATGLIQSYVMGLPFLRNMLLGDLTFTLGLFGLYEMALRNAKWQKVDKRLSGWLVESVELD